jgi:DNA polymerase III delta prime subunit
LVKNINQIKIKKITYKGRQKTNNIHVLKNNNFFLKNGVLTHNTIYLQQALRPVMEMTADQTRFILTCNYPQKIIDPIKSRCQLFEFKSFTKEMIEVRLKQILAIEKVEYKDKDIEQIALYSYPDIRRAINFCQKYVIDNKLVYTKDENLESVNGMIYDLLKKKDWKSIRKLVNNESIIYEDVYKFLFDRMDEPKSLLTIAEYLKNHSIVADPEINFIAMIIELIES